MSDHAKYIVFDDGLLHSMVIFPPNLVHAHMAERLSGLGKPESAGFVGVADHPVDGAKAWAYGESVSLKLKSDPERDSVLANKLLDLRE